MSSASDLAKYFADITAQGCGDHPAYLGTRGLDSLRVNGQPMRLEIPHDGDETDGKRVFLRAADSGAHLIDTEGGKISGRTSGLERPGGNVEVAIFLLARKPHCWTRRTARIRVFNCARAATSRIDRAAIRCGDNFRRMMPNNSQVQP